jgi:hypothetical protein
VEDRAEAHILRPEQKQEIALAPPGVDQVAIQEADPTRNPVRHAVQTDFMEEVPQYLIDLVRYHH